MNRPIGAQRRRYNRAQTSNPGVASSLWLDRFGFAQQFKKEKAAAPLPVGLEVDRYWERWPGLCLVSRICG